VFGVAVLSFWHVHAQDYASETEEHPRAEVRAVWDEDGERGRREASTRGVPFHEDLDELLSREDVDGVVVTTPTVIHREVIPKAASAGKHVFTEKVIAPTLSEAREVVAEVEEARGDLRRLAAKALRGVHAGHTGNVGRG
jgi:1,5-anhydro-D-fructose reductase (1,5-anhydro-D-mannitol-forming)